MQYEAYLGLGSNLGDRVANIRQGLEGLRSMASDLLSSSLYENAPAGFMGQPPFLNAVCRVWTHLDPFKLLHEADRIASEVGHSRAFPNAPRLLDIDILIHGRTVLSAPHLSVPHPRLTSRAFVMTPLAEIAPGLVHPKLGKDTMTLSRQLPGQTILRRIPAAW